MLKSTKSKVAAMMLATAMLLPFVAVQDAHAYSWTRTLQEGASGSDVKELQVRVAGYAADSASQTYVSKDGAFGPGTKAAVIRFQRAHGLTADGIVGPGTQSKLNALENTDGSTAHFNFSEFQSKDGSGFSNGKVSATTVKENVRQLMWKLEGVRQKAGNVGITINSGFRSISHNSAVGGESNSQHMYGIAADIVISGKTVAGMQSIAKTSGFSGIIPYSSFLHVDSRAEYPAYGAASFYWPN